jgi:hypothetical protein
MWQGLERRESCARKPEGNRSLGTSSLKLEHNIKMEPKEIV